LHDGKIAKIKKKSVVIANIYNSHMALRTATPSSFIEICIN